jgi:NADH dehydrogenase
MPTKIVILGAGFGGVYAAQRLQKRLDVEDAEITLIDRHNFMLYYPLLIEATVGIMEPRHVVVPVRKFLKPSARFLMAEIADIDLAAKAVHYRVEGELRTQPYDHLVFALGSVTLLPKSIPGLAEYGFQLKSITDGIRLRDRAIQMLERASVIDDPALRQELLTFVVVGGNLTGVEFAGEYEAFLHAAAKSYPGISRSDIRVVLVEAGDRLLPAMSPRQAEYVARRLHARGVRVETHCLAKALGPHHVELGTGEQIPTQTIVWAAGIAPNPILRASGLPLNERGYIRCGVDMRVEGFDNVWAIGDSAAVPDAHGHPFAATAQNASRQGPAVADNLVAVMRGAPTKPFHHMDLGTFAAFGAKEAAATVLGVDLKGFLGWLIYRGAYLTKYPTFRLKFRLLTDWLGDVLLPYPPVQLGGEKQPTAVLPGAD